MSGLPDPVTLEVARDVQWPYDVVHRCLGQAAELGVRPEEAARCLRLVAGSGATGTTTEYLWGGYLRKWRLLIRAIGKPTL